MSVLIAAPALEPVTLAEAKAWLRIDDSADDARLASLVSTARHMVEKATRRLLISQSWRVEFGAFPCDGYVRLPFAPLRAIAAIRMIDSCGAPHLLTAAQWRVFDAADDPRVGLTSILLTPGRACHVEIDAEFGYGAPEDIPPPLRQAILTLVSAWRESPNEAGMMTSAAQTLIAPFARVRLS